MGTSVMCCYQWSLVVRKTLGVQNLQQAYLMAKQRIEKQLDSLPLGPTPQSRVNTMPVPLLNDTLLQVLRPLAQGASNKEVAELTGLTVDAVTSRKKRILDILQVKTVFEAAQKARELELL